MGQPSSFRAGVEPFQVSVRILNRGSHQLLARTEDTTVRLSLLGLSLVAILNAGCTREPDLPASTSSGPAFDPVAFFDGQTRSWGLIESRFGQSTEQIATDGHGQRDGTERLRMVQHLSFQDGTTQERDWILWRSGPGQFKATANDMVGTAEGEANGRVFHWQWVLARSPGNPLMNVTMQQWMYRMEDGSVTVRTTVTKLGFIVAEVTEQFTRPEKG
jgi:Protein of unknown function (DUF3833)